jgi:adenylosuccinate lyase
MILRYSRPEMREIWTEQRKLEIWLQIELLASEALVQEGIVPKKDFEIMKARAAFTVDRCKDLEKTLNHDVIAFTTNVAESINDPASRWFHFGLTSSDVGDTAFAVQMVQSADIRRRESAQKNYCSQGQDTPIHSRDRAQPWHPRRTHDLRPEDGAHVR